LAGFPVDFDLAFGGIPLVPEQALRGLPGILIFFIS
jgi:hypothetical protein